MSWWPVTSSWRDRQRHVEGKHLAQSVQCVCAVCTDWPPPPPSLSLRVIGSYLGAGEAVHCALHHICHLITVDSVPCKQNLSGLVASNNQKVRPRLELPDVFDLYHLSNQVSPLVAMQAIVGESSSTIFWAHSKYSVCTARSILSVAKEVKRSRKNIRREKVFTHTPATQPQYSP